MLDFGQMIETVMSWASDLSSAMYRFGSTEIIDSENHAVEILNELEECKRNLLDEYELSQLAVVFSYVTDAMIAGVYPVVESRVAA